jgi:hypothetical protein
MFKTQPEDFIKKQLDKCQPLNYNQFRWWRRWDSKNDPLPKKSPLIDKIRNGDFDFSHYFWQAQYCEIELNKKLEKAIDTQHWIETTQLDRARRKRLWEDFEKDENNKLMTIESEFTKKFRITKEEYYKELDGYEGTLEEFYFHCYERFIKSKQNYE